MPPESGWGQGLDRAHVSERRKAGRGQITRRGRYWIASARCAVSIRSLPARSPIVRASFRMRWKALALIWSCCMAARTSARPASSNDSRPRSRPRKAHKGNLWHGRARAALCR